MRSEHAGATALHLAEASSGNGRNLNRRLTTV
jgi:hypothetical protein